MSRPQQLWLRRALFQIHLWIALSLGAYIVVLSVSGSAVVFRRDFAVWLVPRSVPSTAGPRLAADELHDAARAVYAGYEVKEIREPRRPERPVLVALERNGESSERLFDPYAAKDMGHSYPPALRAMEWLVDLHDNLLTGPTGRRLNGIGGALIAVLVVTGAFIWWPGRRRWRQRLLIGRPAKSRRFAWQLHNALGIWSCSLLFVWAATAVYFAFPDPVERTIDFFDGDRTDAHRPGEGILLLLIELHFGRFGGMPVRFLWAALGLLPAVLFVTGFVMWWTRVVRPRRLAWAAAEPAAAYAKDAAVETPLAD